MLYVVTSGCRVTLIIITQGWVNECSHGLRWKSFTYLALLPSCLLFHDYCFGFFVLCCTIII